MARIGDSSDDQRIQEMIEADLRQKKEVEKRGDQERLTRSFQEVMQQRSSKETAQKNASLRESEQAAQAQRKEPQAEANKKKIILNNPRSQELQKRAMLATQQQGQLTKARSELSEAARSLETDRATEIVKRSDDDRERIRGDIDKDRVVDRGVEERAAVLREGPIVLDEDAQGRGQKQKQRGEGEQSEGQPQAAAIGAAKAEATGGAAPTKIPQELIEAIAKQVAIAVAADGRTEIAISLKGSMLEGVTLKVTAKKGKVRCVFEGCDRQLSNLIEASKGDLMRQLGKRGLELDILRTK